MTERLRFSGWTTRTYSSWSRSQIRFRRGEISGFLPAGFLATTCETRQGGYPFGSRESIPDRISRGTSYAVLLL